MMCLLRDANSGELARQVRVSPEIAAAFLAEAQRRHPDAEIITNYRNDGRDVVATIHFPHRDMLELTNHGQRYATVGAFEGGGLGDSYCLILIAESITDEIAADKLRQKFPEVEVVALVDLETVLSDRLADLYARIDTLQKADAAAEAKAAKPRRWRGWRSFFNRSSNR